MKKLLSICFLSILLSMACLVTNAQSGSCCFWLENMQPVTLTDIVNAPDGSGNVVLNNTMNQAVVGHTDTYQVRFTNTCGLPANTKVALEWKLYRDGQLVNGNLSDYCDFKIYSKYARLGQVAQWCGGTVRDGHGTCNSFARVEGFPGAMQPAHDQSSDDAEGYITIGDQYLSLDYFNLPFFDTTETKIVITWKQVGNYSLVVSLRERTNGTDYNTLYWNNEQTLAVGGHQSQCGTILASDSIHYLVKTNTSKEVCHNDLPYTYGMPPYDFTIQGNYFVIFGAADCGHFVVDKLDTFHFFVRRNPQIVAPATITMCENDPNLTVAHLMSSVSYDPIYSQGITDSLIEWSNDNVTFSTDAPSFYTAPGSYTYYVRQTNIYNNFGEVVTCEGSVSTITYTVNPVPAIPVVQSPAYTCVDNILELNSLATAATDCKLMWDTNINFAHAQVDMMANTSVAGTFNYYVYQVNTVTGCFSTDNYNTVALTVYALPEVTATATPAAVCLGDNITLEATPDTYNVYAWADPVFANTATTTYKTTTVGSFTYDVTVSEIHTVAGVDVATCRKTFTTNEVVVNPIPATPVVKVSTFDICNENPVATQTLTATPGTDGTICKWYLAGSLVYTGNSYDVTLSDIRPVTNVDKTVTYYVTSYNETTGCETALADAMPVSIIFHQTPEFTFVPSSNTTVCPGTTVTVEANVTSTETEAPYNYAWSGDMSSSSTNTATIVTNSDDCGVTYSVTATVTDDNGCSATQTFVVNVNDENGITLSSTSSSNTYNGCDETDAPTAYTTVADFEAGFGVTITDKCSNATIISSTDVVATPDACQTIVTRTYTISDVCGNKVTYVHTITIKDQTNPVLPDVSSKPVILDPVVNSTNCTYNAPSRATLLAAMADYFAPSDNCASASYLAEHAVFTLGSTTTIADGALDIFAGLAPGVGVTIQAQVVDECNNASAQYANIYIPRPDPMDITAGAITALPSEICLHDTVFLNFAPTHVINAKTNYTYWWSAVPNDGSIIFNTQTDALGVPATAGIYYSYIIKVTDANHCVAYDTAAPVYVNPLPSVYIDSVILNGSTFPLCPNYGVLTVKAHATSNLATPISSYTWAGESVNIHSTQDTTGVYIIPDSCNHLYTAFVTVKNAKGCKATDSYNIPVEDLQAPQIVNFITDSTVSISTGCKLFVPDFVAMLGASTITDNCYLYTNMTIAQNPVAGTEMTENTPVTITITDPCGNSSNYIVNANKPSNFLQVDITALPDPICFGENTTLTANVTNATGSVSYSWNTTATTNPLTVKPAEGNPVYSITVTDALNCTATDDITLTVHHTPIATDVTFTTTPNEYCYNATHIANGTIAIASLPAGYTYKMNTDADWHTSDYVYTGLAAATYSFDLKSDFDCIASAITTATVIDDTTSFVHALATATQNDYCDPARYNGTLTVTNPQAGHSYELINIPNSFRAVTDATLPLIYDKLAHGTYGVHQTTDKYCHYILSDVIVVDARVFPTLADGDTTITPYSDCATPNGQLFFSNPVIGYTYALDGFTILATPTQPVNFTGLVSGTFHLTITTDKGCDSTFSVTIPSRNIETPIVTSSPNTICDNANLGYNGSVTVVGPTNGYTYSMVGIDTVVYSGAGDVTFNGLAKGDYTMYFINDMHCAGNVPFTVEDSKVNPTAPSTVVNDNYACVPALANGVVTVLDPDADYTYSLSLGSVNYPYLNGSFNNLAANTYTLKTTINNTGCFVTSNVRVNDEVRDIDLNSENVTVTNRTDCDNANGVISFTAVSGCTYELTQGTIVIPTPYNTLSAGDYTLTKTITATGCTFAKDYTVGEDFPVYTITTDVVADSHCDATIGNGTITVNNSDAANYEFSLDGVSYSMATSFADLNEGSYTVYARNLTTHCPSHVAVTVGGNYEYPKLIVDATAANYYCTTVKNGSIQVSASVPSTYILIEKTDTNTTGLFENLDHGTYTVKAISTLGCSSADESVVVKDSAFIPTPQFDSTANTMCAPTFTHPGNGTIKVLNPEGLQYDYSFYDKNGNLIDVNYFVPTSYTMYHLFHGDYRVVISDSITGCSLSDTVNVPFEQTVPKFHATTTDNTLCSATLGNGTLTIVIDSALVPEYCLYSIDSVNYTTSNTFTGLIAGSYTIYVKDTTTNCDYISAPDAYTIGTNNAGAPNISIVANGAYLDSIYCYNAPASLTASATNSVSGDSFTYVWSTTATDATTTIPTSTVGVSTYTVSATSQLTNCTNVASKKIQVRANPDISFTVNGSATGVLGTSTHHYAVCQNATPLTLSVAETYPVYAWIGGNVHQDTTINALANGATTQYTASVTDDYGCSSTRTFFLDATTVYRHTFDQALCATTNVTFRGKDYIFDYTNNANNFDTITITYTSQLGCDSIVTYNIKLMALPTFTKTEWAQLSATHCHGDVIPTSITSNANNSTVTAYGWYNMDNTTHVFSPASSLTRAMNGNRVYYYAENDCGIAYSDTVTLHVDSLPSNIASFSTYAIDTVCAGEAFYTNPTYDCNSADCTTQWQISDDGITFTERGTSPFKYSEDGKYVQFIVSNHCGDSYSDVVRLNVDTTVIATISGTELCRGIINFGDLNFLSDNFANTVVTDTNLVVDGIAHNFPFDMSSLTVGTHEMYYEFVNHCGTSASNILTIDVRDIPTIAKLSDVITCIGSFALTMPAIINNGSAVTDSTWQISDNVTPRVWTDIDSADIPALANSGKLLRFSATNGCGTGYSDEVQLKLSDKPSLSGSVGADITQCEGTTLGLLPAITVHNNNAVLTFDGYEIQKVLSTTWVTLPTPLMLSKDYDNALIRYRAANACGETVSDTLELFVTDTAYLQILSSNITPNMCHSFRPFIKYDIHLDNDIVAAASSDAFSVTMGTNDTLFLDFGTYSDAPQYIALKSDGSPCGVKYDTISFKISDVPEVSLTVDPVCAGTAITPTVSVDSNNAVAIHHIEWKSATLPTWTTDVMPSRFSYNGEEIRLVASNKCGADTSVYTAVQVDTNYLTISALDQVCAADGATIDFTSNVNTSISFTHPATVNNSLSGNSYVLSDLVGYDTIKGTITNDANVCPAAHHDFSIIVNTLPTVSWASAYTDTVCVGAAYNLPVLTTKWNTADASANATQYFTVKNGVWSPLTVSSNADLANDTLLVRAVVTNNCGSDTTDALTLHVSGAVTIAFTTDTVCAGSTLDDFVSDAAVTTTGSTRILAEGWQVKTGTTWADATLATTIDTQDSVRYYVTTACGTYDSPAQILIKNRAPKFDDASVSTNMVDANLTACHNTALVNLPKIDYNNNGATLTDSVWQIVHLGVATPIDNTTLIPDSLNGSDIYCIITNVCGSDTAKGKIVINSLPTPMALGDTSICNGASLNVHVLNPNANSTYSWTLNSAIVSNSSSFTHVFPIGTPDPRFDTLVVTETDINGCVNTDMALVRVSDLPEFIFRDAAGNRTHHLDQTTGTNFTKYSVEVDPHCYEQDTLVYLQIQLYRDGQLMANSSTSSPHHVDSCLRAVNYMVSGNTLHWYIQDSINWKSSYPSLASNLKISYYDNSNIATPALKVDGGYHYPRTPFIAGNVFDDIYLHFLANRPIYAKVAPFRKHGEYKIVYKLYSTSTKNEYKHLYHNDSVAEMAGNMIIGGQNFYLNANQTLLAWDTLTISVTGPDLLPIFTPAPIITPVAPSVETASMKVYPNPANDVITVNVDGMSGKSVFMISNLSGKVLNQEDITIPAGATYQYKYSVSSFVPGIYFVTVKSENATLTRKLVIAK